MNMPNHSIQFLVVILLIIGTYYVTKQTTDNYYRNNSTHKTDTVYIFKYIQLPTIHDTIKVLVKPTSKPDSIRIDTTYEHLTKDEFRMIASPVDTTMNIDTLGTNRIIYDPLSRLLTTELKLFPFKLPIIHITDSVSYHVPVNVSFQDKATLVGIGSLIGIIITLLLK